VPIIMANLGSLRVLNALRTGLLNDLGCALYVNNFLPFRGMAIDDFTEASFPGYAPLSPVFPNVAILNGDAQAQVSSDLLTWTASGASAQTAFGFFLYNVETVVIFAQRFDAPVNMSAPGTSLDLTIHITDVSQFNG